MDCNRCGARNDDDAAYCDRCGAALRPAGAAPTREGSPAGPVLLSSPVGPMPRSVEPVVYAPARRHAWWFPIGVWAILSAFFLFADLMVTHAISWSIWPVGVTGIFLVGFPLLGRLEQWSLARGGKPGG